MHQLAVVLAFWASYQLGKAAVRARRGLDAKQAFVLAVTLKFNSLADRDAFINIWRPLAEYVQRQEPTTYSFKLLIADTDPTKVLVYERYPSKQAFTDVHRTSERFLAFKQAQASLPFEVQVEGQSYLESEGFM